MKGLRFYSVPLYTNGMSEGKIANYQTFKPDTGDADKLIILLHGLGSNGSDLISLAPYWTKFVPGAVFVSPDAPFACDMVPPGYPNAYQWFSLQDRDPKIMLQGIRQAAPILEGFIGEQLQHHNIAPEKCALVGFSQGTMMSLYQGPRSQYNLAGILGYSGALIWGQGDERLHKLPVHLIHGEQDDVVPVEAWGAAKDTLSQHGFSVSGYTQPGLQHSIDERGIESGGEFLAQILA